MNYKTVYNAMMKQAIAKEAGDEVEQYGGDYNPWEDDDPNPLYNPLKAVTRGLDIRRGYYGGPYHPSQTYYLDQNYPGHDTDNLSTRQLHTIKETYPTLYADQKLNLQKYIANPKKYIQPTHYEIAPGQTLNGIPGSQLKRRLSPPTLFQPK